MGTVKNLGSDLGSDGDNWLFRQEGLVLGPVPGKKLVEMLFAGEIDGRTEVAPMGSSSFQPLARVDHFKVHYAKAEAKKRVDVSAEQDRARSAKQRNVKALVLAGSGLVFLSATAAGAWYLATNTGVDDLEAYALANITVDPPQIWGSSGDGEGDEELLEYPGTRPPPPTREPTRPVATAAAAATPTPARPPAAPPTPAAVAPRPEKQARPTPAPKKERLAAASADPDGMQTAQFDQSAINGVVAQNQKRLFPCFKEEAERSPGFAAKIPMEFVIGNDGRVAKLWVDNPRYKDGPLYDCLFRELQKWPFKPYEGERATVGLSFNIGKR
jgi:hypothetical protein